MLTRCYHFLLISKVTFSYQMDEPSIKLSQLKYCSCRQPWTLRKLCSDVKLAGFGLDLSLRALRSVALGGGCEAEVANATPAVLAPFQRKSQFHTRLNKLYKYSKFYIILLPEKFEVFDQFNFRVQP